MNTSSVILVFCALAITMVVGNHEKFHEAIAKCKEELSIDDEMFENHKKNHFISEDPKLKCWGACLMKKMGTMTNEGVVMKEKAIEMIPADMKNRDKLMEAIETCSIKSGADECETASMVHKCIKEKMPERPQKPDGN
ncbi:hypothetical protein HCN44_000018 [Aphidius gifuensis]|uniref:Odorant-binding protein n=1 Tax=Aphidius gifuensis TaxID=684658 RepID=A0A3S9LWE5_APHGI|nr:uncharacterized protein LOC122855415 [Aphidius gifuensis]AZQ25002.1 odorant-binding protein [Aphidius gifuensis]KAF7990213.1 hypothetical protein HCN44_000018 [Aphidius gifuensis]